MADFFLADCPPVDGGSYRIRSDPPRTLADFLCPHKVRLSPPESAEKRSSADTGADSGGQWRTQADLIGSAADSGGQLSASFSAQVSLTYQQNNQQIITMCHVDLAPDLDYITEQGEIVVLGHNFILCCDWIRTSFAADD